MYRVAAMFIVEFCPSPDGADILTEEMLVKYGRLWKSLRYFMNAFTFPVRPML